MRETIDKLYLLMIQSLRYEMRLIDDKTWSENLDILLEAERDQTKTKLNSEFGVSTAGYNNDPISNEILHISKSVPDENFWKEQDFLYTEPEKPAVYPIDRILEGENEGDLIFLFYDANVAKKACAYLSKLCSKNTFYSINVMTKEIDDERMGLYKLYMEDGDKKLIIGFKKAVYVVAFIARFVRFSKFGNYFVMEGE